MQNQSPLLQPLDVSKYKHPVLAKPSGITLEQHIKNVVREAEDLCTMLPTTLEKYQAKTEKSLQHRLQIVAKMHDDGKRHNRWQVACQADYDNYQTWLRSHEGSFWNYSQAMYDEAGKNLQKAGIRHEFQSLVANEKKRLPICLQAAIAAHHGKLGFRHEQRWKKEGVMHFWNAFQIESNRVLDENLSLQQIAKLQYEYAGPRGYLQLADHRASAIEEKAFVPPHNVFQYRFNPNWQKRPVQKLAEQNWQDQLLLIRAATGAGKTDASLLWATKQIENGRAERLVIAMPTRFTSNALAINVAESLSDTGLYHSSAWFHKFHEDVEFGRIDKKDASKIHEFARLLHTPVTVCTIDHLLMALTLTREEHHLITFNLANSCLVIDEADFYDDFTQANILVLLEILRYWNVPILLMSASLPESVLPDYQKIGYDISQIKEDKDNLEDYQRCRFELKSKCFFSNLSEIEDILELCVAKGCAIIYANTIDHAVAYWKWFRKRGVKTCLYHSRFTEPDKQKKEELLLDMLGKTAWSEGTANGIAILTQIGEMSINISADLMISEICPIDRLTQRVGRLCRFNKNRIGSLYLLIPEKEGKLYPAPYGDYDRKAKCWSVSKALTATLNVLELTYYSVEKLVILLNDIYSERNDFSSKAIDNAKNLKEYFKCNWLINSKQMSRKDDTGTNFWQSRNIPPQSTVFVSAPDSKYFSNYLEYQSWKLKNSVEVPVYLVEKARKHFMIDVRAVRIRDEEENIYIVREGFYSFLKGVDFTEEESTL